MTTLHIEVRKTPDTTPHGRLPAGPCPCDPGHGHRCREECDSLGKPIAPARQDRRGNPKNAKTHEMNPVYPTWSKLPITLWAP